MGKTYNTVCGRCLHSPKRTPTTFWHLNITFSDLCLCQNRLVSLLPKLLAQKKKVLNFMVVVNIFSKTCALFLNMCSTGCFDRFKHVSTSFSGRQLICHFQIFARSVLLPNAIFSIKKSYDIKRHYFLKSVYKHKTNTLSTLSLHRRAVPLFYRTQHR